MTKMFNRWCNNEENVCDYINYAERHSKSFKLISIIHVDGLIFIVFYRAKERIIW